VATVLVEGPGRPREVRVGPAGAFLLLYDERVAANQVRVTPR
jgi:glucose/arabinose dehydrogenase